MQKLVVIAILSSLAAGCCMQKPSSQTAAQPRIDSQTSPIKVTGEPAYYRRFADDSLVSAEAAQRGEDFNASGIVLRVVSPESWAGKIVAFHFDFPEKWNAWYKAGELYEGTIDERAIGTMAFMCDPGWKSPSEDAFSR